VDVAHQAQHLATTAILLRRKALKKHTLGHFVAEATALRQNYGKCLLNNFLSR
jgi:hypothetical protein